MSDPPTGTAEGSSLDHISHSMDCKSSFILYTFFFFYKKKRKKMSRNYLTASLYVFLLNVASITVHVASDFRMITSAHCQGAWNEVPVPGSVRAVIQVPHHIQSCDKSNCNDLLLTGVESSLQSSVAF